MRGCGALGPHCAIKRRAHYTNQITRSPAANGKAKFGELGERRLRLPSELQSTRRDLPQRRPTKFSP